jgi:hypothetical protein
MVQLLAELERHHPDVAKRVVGSVPIDEKHTTEPELLARAREFYAKVPPHPLRSGESGAPWELTGGNVATRQTCIALVSVTDWSSATHLQLMRRFMLWTLLLVLVILWALGLGFGVAGNLIHILLVVAVIVLVLNLVQGRRVS